MDRSYREASLRLDLDSRTLREFCDRHDLATCGVVRTAWAIVVSQYAAVEHVSFVYSTNDGRSSDPEAEKSCLFRAQINPGSRLSDILLAAKKDVDGIMNPHDRPKAEDWDDASNLAASAFTSRLDVHEWVERQVGHIEQDKSSPECQVSVTFAADSDASFSVSVRVNTLEFSVAQAGDIAHTLAKTLDEIVGSHPQSLVNDLDTCSQHDLKRIQSWNEPIPEPIDSCYHWQFEKVARKSPNAMAICSWDRSFTYRELDLMSTKLANNLRHIGVRPETFVGICFDKTSMAYVCMLSILKAGGAFVAIDPSYPASRIQAIVKATGASIFVAEPKHCHLFNDFAKHIMAIDASTVDELPYTPSLPGPHIDPSNLAYAVFTSGSTGSPKGIMIEHRSLCTATRALASPMQIDASSRVLQFAAYTFDVSYGDTFVTWAQGGCVCVPSEYERINDISSAIVRMDVNNACLIPSVARLLQPESVPCLKTLNLGGEALVKDNLDVWAEKLTLSVVYGPSECTVWCTSETGLKTDTLYNTIGHGIGTLLWVTSATNHDRLCPVGCIGELLIEGPGLARGYLGPEQTKNTFVENPSWANAKPGHCRRFYKTGDLVRYRPDGALTFIGRKDSQIKLHGRRIELGEIEYHLSCHDSLQQSLVLFPSSGKYRQKLVAIVAFETSVASNGSFTELQPLTGVAEQKFANELAEIKQSLSSKLPFYMLPQEWIVVERIPLLVSGKMNRILSRRFVENLTEPDRNDTYNASSQDRIHDNVVEDHLRQIWSQVLKVDAKEVGITNGFVSLGGDSFTAMDLVARCKAEGYNFTATDVLDDSTIRQMAAKAKAAASPQEGHQPVQSHHKLTSTRPLVLRPVWWDTDDLGVAIA